MLVKIKNEINPPPTVLESLKEVSSYIEIDDFPDKGGNGYLFFGKNKILKKRVAIKYYYYGNDSQYHEEPMFLSDCVSEYILPIHHAKTVCDEWALFITDYCKNGDLEDYIDKNNISVFDTLIFCMNLLKGLSCIHSKRMLHRDLKPQNIFINDSNKPVIGDFGSVKLIPEGESVISGSGHSILYRPPESIKSGEYSIEGDIYQIGIILYQLLSGDLPYDGLKYLSKLELRKYHNIEEDIDKTLYIDEIIKHIIVRGKLLNYKSIPIWINKRLIGLIKKSTNVDPKKRYHSCSEFMNEIMNVRRKCLNWSMENSILTVKKKKEYRIICNHNSEYFIEKRKHSSWRRDNSIELTKDLKRIIEYIRKDLK